MLAQIEKGIADELEKAWVERGRGNRVERSQGERAELGRVLRLTATGGEKRKIGRSNREYGVGLLFRELLCRLYNSGEELAGRFEVAATELVGSAMEDGKALLRRERHIR